MKTEAAALRAGETQSEDNGERMGRSAGGRIVLMRRRRSAPGFVVTADAEALPDVPNEVIRSDWAAANAAFAKMMRAY